MAAPRKIDWDFIEPGWRAGIKSVQQLADEYRDHTKGEVTVTKAAISKHFKKQGIARDLSEKVRAKADAMVSASMVSGKVSTETKETERAIIDANAQVQADIQIAHRRDIQRARKITMSLLDELELTTDNRELFEQLGEVMRSPDDKGADKRNEIYAKVISMAGRVDSMKKLAETLRILVEKERQAFGIDKEDGGKSASALVEGLRKLQEMGEEA